MLDRAIKCALWMKKQGATKGDIIALSTHNHLDSFIPYIAGLFIGATINPWNHEMNTSLARHFMGLTRPKIIFANEESAGIIMEAAKIELFHPKVVVFGNYLGTIPFSAVLQGHSESEVANFECTNIANIKETSTILFSSGTTGLPKGVQLSHEVIVSCLENLESFRFKSVIPLWFSSLYWISGTMLSLKSISGQTKRIIAPQFDPQTVCEVVEKYKVTWLMLSTSMANRFVRYNGLHNYDLSSLSLLLVGGATLKQESQDALNEHLPHTTVLQAYGMTELGGLVAAQTLDSTSGSCGVVIPNSEIKIIDPDTGKILGANQNGELCAKTPTVMNGYYKNPEATREILDADGWLHSGDLAYYNEKGEVFIIDRLKEIIKYRGHQITPTEIENLLQAHPAVLEVAVVSIPHPTDDEHPIAFVSKVPHKEVSAEELILRVENNLLDVYKLRGGVKFLPKLPHTHSGKISRKDLKAMANSMAVK
ncbi:Luciferin 4-monooxygenase [Dufourea novaeangliae]|uniref:Luciferin 4-monooxygenase n=2 Tax=Dufourea novaeangliae TaxID=178035 RepID=A0A154PJT2_DUFNO|nr:Luciferin 4-monooxygenase [Dufourea novaeangliae]